MQAPYALLQRKARNSFQKLLRLDGKLDRQLFAFVYLTNTVAASEGLHFKRMADLRQGMSEFRPAFQNFNQMLSHSQIHPNSPIKPTVLVVADEIFTMNER